MPLDFPSNPVHGQTYENYTYDIATGSWVAGSSKSGLSERLNKLETYPVINGSMYVNTDAPATYANNLSNFSQMWQNSGTNAIGVALGDDLKAGLVTNNGYSLSLGTSGVTRMNIDTSGRVTLPYQPSFKAYQSSGGQINDPTNPTPLVFPDTSGWGGHNVGSHYNTSNGRFTAPIAGRYMFTGSMLMNPASSSNDPGYTLVMIYINGAQAHYFCHNHNPGWIMEGSAVIFNLAQGDYVNLSLIYGSGHYGQFSWFAGALLS